MSQAFQRGQQARIEGFTGNGVVNGTAINLRGAGAVIKRLGTAFNLQRMYAQLGEPLNVLDGSQIF
ncbi:hypothetical protein D3C79_498400 [compost metagenome]